MKRYIKRVILFTSIFGLSLLVAAVNADAVNADTTSQVFIATNNDIQKNIEASAAAFVKPDLWYRTNSGLWYYFENEWTTTRTGWFVDPRDGQTYYLKPENGIMAVGWKKIGDDEYYFNDNKEAENCWFELGGGFYEKLLNGQLTYGALYKDCMTPDGKMVDKDGKLIK